MKKMKTQTKQELQEIAKVTDEAIDSSIKGVNGDWAFIALEAVAKCSYILVGGFTANDVRAWMAHFHPNVKTHDNRAMGGVMKTAVKLGWIKPSGRTIVSKVGHKSLLQIWESNLK